LHNKKNSKEEGKGGTIDINLELAKEFDQSLFNYYNNQKYHQNSQTIDHSNLAQRSEVTQ